MSRKREKNKKEEGREKGPERRAVGAERQSKTERKKIERQYFRDM